MLNSVLENGINEDINQAIGHIAEAIGGQIQVIPIN